MDDYEMDQYEVAVETAIMKGQSPEEYVSGMLDVRREIKSLLRPEGMSGLEMDIEAFEEWKRKSFEEARCQAEALRRMVSR